MTRRPPIPVKYHRYKRDQLCGCSGSLGVILTSNSSSPFSSGLVLSASRLVSCPTASWCGWAGSSELSTMVDEWEPASTLCAGSVIFSAASPGGTAPGVVDGIAWLVEDMDRGGMRVCGQRQGVFQSATGGLKRQNGERMCSEQRTMYLFAHSIQACGWIGMGMFRRAQDLSAHLRSLEDRRRGGFIPRL